jgi:hypothetical protein
VKALKITLGSLASVGLALYTAAITIRVEELDPGPLVFWPYEWLWWLVVPTALVGVGFVIVSDRSGLGQREPKAVAPKPRVAAAQSGGGLRIAKPWKEHAGIQSHRNFRNGDRDLRWISNGAKAGTLEQGPRGQWDVFDEDDNHLGTVSTELEGMELVARSS